MIKISIRKMSQYIESLFEISKKLVSQSVIDSYFFPQNDNDMYSIMRFCREAFSHYLELNFPRLNTNRKFNIYENTFAEETILVIEIGGTKTTVQKISTINDEKIIYPQDVEAVLKTIDNLSELVSVQEFILWISDLINTYKGDCQKIAINLAGAVDEAGIVLLSPPNIKVQDMIGINLVQELQKRCQNLHIKIFNDTESVMAAQFANKQKNEKQIIIDINGTGNNNAIYDDQHIIHNLETGHVKCIPQESIYVDFEKATGGRNGVEKNFNEILFDTKIERQYYDTQEIYNMAFEKKSEYDKTDQLLLDIASLVYNRVFFYKAISFISIAAFSLEKKIDKNHENILFVLFGGINKSPKSIEMIKEYLQYFQQDINLEYTNFGEDAGRYGAAMMMNAK